MKINKQEILEALRIVKPGLGDEKALEQSTSFAFVGNKVVTYNDQISISHPVTNLDITGAVKAQELYQLLERIKADELNFDISDNQILITSGKLKAGLTVENEISLPILDVENKKWNDLPDNFIECLDFAYPICSTDMSRLILTCINCHADVMESSDSFRILKQKLSSDINVNSFLLPAFSAKSVVQMQPTEINVSKGWVHFKTVKGSVISCRTVEGEFPTVKHHFTNEGVKIQFPKRINDIIERAQIFSKKDFVMDEKIMIQMKANKMVIASKSEVGWSEETAGVKYGGDKVAFEITPILFKHVLKQTQTFLLDENKVTFSGPNWEYLLLLKRIK